MQMDFAQFWVMLCHARGAFPPPLGGRVVCLRPPELKPLLLYSLINLYLSRLDGLLTEKI
jgi:hypothetical protein